MIPITVFAGKTVAVFGLGKSGLLSARRADQGRRRGRRLRRQREDAWPRRRAAGLTRRICANSIGRQSPRWCWRRACRSRIRSRIGRVQLAHKASVEIIGDIELFCRERAKSRRAMSADRHHRHQRQIDHHRAHRASARQRRPRRADGRQYRRAGAGAGAVRGEPRLRARSVLLPDRSRAFAARHRRHPAQRDRRPSRPPRHAWRITPRIKTLLPAQRRAGRHRGDRRRRRLDARRRRAHRARRQKVVRVSVHGAAARRLLRRGQPHHARAGRQGAAGRRSSPASARCAARTMRRTPPAPSPPASRSASISPRFRKAWPRFPASPHRMQQIGRKGTRAVTSTIPKRPMPTRAAQGARRASTIFSGSPAASRRPAASPASPNSSRASARPI